VEFVERASKIAMIINGSTQNWNMEEPPWQLRKQEVATHMTPMANASTAALGAAGMRQSAPHVSRRIWLMDGSGFLIRALLRPDVLVGILNGERRVACHE